MPIVINVPGGKFDSAGQGMAAAQQYRAGEQRMKAVSAEVDLATRKLDIEEQDMQFQREQLAQQQEAAGDLLVAEMGAGLTPAQQQALRMVSPRTQNVLFEGVARNKRLAAERETFTRADGQLAELEGNDYVGEDAAELRARIDGGEMTTGAAVNAIARLQREADKTALVERQFVTVSAQMEKWIADETGAYDPPKEDDDAYDDVVDLEAKLSPNAPFDPKADYRALWDQYKFLTTRGMREASRAILAAELKKKGLVPVDQVEYEKMLDERLAESSTQPGFREKAAVTYGQAAPFLDRVRQNVGMGGSTSGADAPKQEPGSLLKAPIGEAEREQMYGKTDEGLREDFNDAMNILGFVSIPQPGEPGYEVAMQVMSAVKARRAAPGSAKKKQGSGQEDVGAAIRSTWKNPLDSVGDAASFVGRKIVESAPTEAEQRANVRKNERSRGVSSGRQEQRPSATADLRKLAEKADLRKLAEKALETLNAGTEAAKGVKLPKGKAPESSTMRKMAEGILDLLNSLGGGQ